MLLVYHNNMLLPPARSGWYRLMLSQMQEESLKQDEDRKRKKEEAEALKIKKSVAPAVRKSLPPSRPKRSVIATELAIAPRIADLPIYNKGEGTASPELDLLLLSISLDFRGWRDMIPLVHKRLMCSIASNDEEDDIELLLLAA